MKHVVVKKNVSNPYEILSKLLGKQAPDTIISKIKIRHVDHFFSSECIAVGNNHFKSFYEYAKVR